MSHYDPNLVTSPGQLSASISSPRRTHRSTRNHRTRTSSRRQQRSPSEEPPLQPPSPRPGRLEVPNVPEIRVTSPPMASPNEQPVMLPGGGVEIPPDLHIEPTFEGHYRPQSADIRLGEPHPSQLFGRFFRGIRKLPATVLKAGRRDQLESVPEMQQQENSSVYVDSPERITNNLPTRSDVETYVEQQYEEDDISREHIAHEYNQRRRVRRDRMFERRSLRDRFVPPPQPVPVPGSNTPAPSQIGHSQAGYPDANVSSLRARLEAEQQRQELQALSEAQAIERSRHIYAADAVMSPPSSIVSADQPPHVLPFSDASRRLPLSPRVYSRWAAPAYPQGSLIENTRSEPLPSSPFTAIIRLYRQIRDMPWVGDRVAADYVPGGRKPYKDPNLDTAYPLPDSAFASPLSQQSGLPPTNSMPANPLPRSRPGRSWYTPSSPRPHSMQGRSWYGAEDSIVRTDDGYDFIALPDGVPPPPGFVRYPYPIPEGARAVIYPGGGGGRDGQSAISYTQSQSGRSRIPQIQRPAPSASGVGSAYSRYMPAEASPFGESYVFVPGVDDRHLQVGSEAGRQPASVYPQSIAQSGIPESLRPGR